MSAANPKGEAHDVPSNLSGRANLHDPKGVS